MDRDINIIFCGIGGQGVLKAAEICGRAALYQGYNVKKSEIHGMSQRGGSVESHLRFGKRIQSPLIPNGKADYVLCLHQGEKPAAERYRNSDTVNIAERVPADVLLAVKERFVNVFMLGVLSSYLNIERGNWMKAIKDVVPVRYVSINRKEFTRGKLTGGAG